jgi:hypothetical protein
MLFKEIIGIYEPYSCVKAGGIHVPYLTIWLCSPLWALAFCANSLQVTSSPCGIRLICYPRPRYSFLTLFVLYDEVVSLMRHPLPGEPGGGGFCRGPIPLAPVVSTTHCIYCDG